MNRTTNADLLRILAAANPVPASRLTPDELARSEETLHRLTRARPTATAARRRRPLRALLASLVAAAVALTASLLAAPATAQEVLLEAARNVDGDPLPSGAYWYVRTEQDFPESIPHQREVWLSADRWVVRDEQSAAFAAWEAGSSTIDPRRVRAEEPQVEGGGLAIYGDGRQLTWDEVEALPTDPEDLARMLTTDLPASGHGTSRDTWRQTVSLLESSAARPALRRALWQVIATIPEVELQGSTQDSTGRAATAIEADFTDQRLERYDLLLDPQSGALLETRIYDLDGTLIYRSTLLEERAVDSAPQATDP